MSTAHMDDPAPWPEGGLEPVPACPVCSARGRAPLHLQMTDRAYEHTPGTWNLYRCTSCSCAYLDPRPTPQTLPLAYREYYTHDSPESQASGSMTGTRRLKRALGNGYRNWRFGTKASPATRLGIVAAWFLPGTRRWIDLQFRNLPKPAPGARLLDVGFGDGAFLEHARSAGWRVMGVDPDPVTVASARARGLDAYQGDLHTLPAQPESFDAVTLSHVIEHVYDPRRFLQQAYRLLKPGGLAWIETPNLDSDGHRRFGASWRGLEPPRHLVLFGWEPLEALLRAEGFRDIRRLPRHEMYATQAVKSEGIRRGWRPRQRPAPGLDERALNWLLGLGSRLDPRRAEYVTLLAAKPSPAPA